MVADGDPSEGVTAAATISTKYRLGRFFRGPLLTLIVSVRQLFVILVGIVTTEIAFGDVMIAPSFLILTDLPTGRRIAKLSLGRDAYTAEEVRRAVERDLHALTRAQFLEAWAPGWAGPQARRD